MVEPMPSLRRFLRDQTGAVTIEFTTLVPAFVLLMVFFADASVIYLTHSEMFEVARDISRRMSTGEITTEQEVETYAAEHLFLGQRTYNVSVEMGNDMQLAIWVPIGEAAIFGVWFHPIIGKSLVATVVMNREPPVVQAN